MDGSRSHLVRGIGLERGDIVLDGDPGDMVACDKHFESRFVIRDMTCYRRDGSLFTWQEAFYMSFVFSFFLADTGTFAF